MTKKQFMALKNGDVIWWVSGVDDRHSLPHVTRARVKCAPRAIKAFMGRELYWNDLGFSVDLCEVGPGMCGTDEEFTALRVMERGHVTKSQAYLSAARIKTKHAAAYKKAADALERWAARVIKKYSRKAK